MLTKKDYVELARIIRDCTVVPIGTSPVYIMPQKLVDKLCFWLRMDNPNFDESRFRDAALPTLPALPKTEYTKRR